MKATLAVIPGDGIGPEIVPQAVKSLEVVARRFGHDFTFVPVEMGFETWKKTGSALSDQSIQICAKSDGILLGATGGLDSDYTIKDFPPGWGRRQLLRELQHRISVRPAKAFAPTINASPTKAERIQGMDLVVVRDMTLINKLGLFETGEGPSGRYAIDRIEFNETEIAPTLKFAFLLARSRRRKLCLMTQSSIFATARLWLKMFEEMASEYPDIEVEIQAPDNCAMQFMRSPARFDVIVCDNTPMGGMLNNLAALLIGSIGMAQGTSLGLKDGQTYQDMVLRNGIYEPIHGAAPLRAGQNIANPIGTILAGAMLLRYSLGLEAEAQAIEHAVEAVLEQGYCTYDIMEAGKKKIGTAEMGDRIAGALES